ncbi:carbohydrate sulfotransferase 12-like [Electrophorus electricus]|nr:carbohydrate sulfotransferase 12-like [Electrophorus electricus]
MFYIKGNWKGRTEVYTSVSSWSQPWAFKPIKGQYGPQLDSANSSFVWTSLRYFYNLLLNGFKGSTWDTYEEDTDLESRTCEWKIHTSPIPLKLKYGQYARKKLIRDLCNHNRTLNFSEQWQAFDELSNEELEHLLVDDRHGIIYCYVPKVACSQWKRIMIVLSESLKVNGVPFRNPSQIPNQYVHSGIIQHLNKYPRDVIKDKLKHYKKFIFVRDPFVRLISAYRDKLEAENQVYYKLHGIPILRKFGNCSKPPESVHQAHAAKIIPSFSNFTEYILSFPVKLLDEHWKPMTQLCHPCQIDYDFIGKLENIEEDATHLLRVLHVDNIIQFPSSSKKTNESWIKSWFSSITSKSRNKLYKLYEADFKIFGYQYSNEIPILQ